MCYARFSLWLQKKIFLSLKYFKLPAINLASYGCAARIIQSTDYQCSKCVPILAVRYSKEAVIPNFPFRLAGDL